LEIHVKMSSILQPLLFLFRIIFVQSLSSNLNERFGSRNQKNNEWDTTKISKHTTKTNSAKATKELIKEVT